MKLLLVVLIVLINFNEFSYQLPSISFNVRDINVHVHGAGMEAGQGVDQGADHDHVDHLGHVDSIGLVEIRRAIHIKYILCLKYDINNY